MLGSRERIIGKSFRVIELFAPRVKSTTRLGYSKASVILANALMPR